ncbi:MAG: hypothetical protein LBC27_04475 [Spirochaetaceae bacterium]|nr:hypothetical protein [Spirochaetaceae bacterium]
MTGNNFSTGSITRKDAFTTAMFAVQDNSTLTLGNGSKPLIIDGSVLALEGGGG